MTRRWRKAISGPTDAALIPSIIMTAWVPFLVGVGSARATKRSLFKGGVEMVSVSLGSALIGYVIGQAAHRYFAG